MEEDKEHIGNSSCRGVVGGAAGAAAPFVVKTYRMVDDPATDALVAWGGGNNSFVVVDPFGFAQRLLPAHFKHANFSSFVRQLNTYGFQKVDPDRWEFAHQSFLRGKTHLLRRIVRRSGGGHRQHGGCDHNRASKEGGRGGEVVDYSIVAEVARLKQKQRAVEEQVRSMWRRVEETESKRRQMLAFLFKGMQDPRLLSHHKEHPPFPVQQDTCLGLHPSEKQLPGVADLLFGRGDTASPVLPAYGPVGYPPQFLPEFVGGGGLGMDKAAAASHPFALPPK